MNVSSRKTTNQSYKRESFPYPSHQPSSGNIQDGMSLSGTNSLPLAAGGTASVPSAASSISPHTTPYLPAPSLTAQTHIPQTPYHISHTSASSTQPTLLSTHSQGPTPSSTPPTVPNETKGPGQYQNYTHTMNQHHLQYRIPVANQIIVNNNPTRGHSTQRLQMPRYATLNTPGHPGLSQYSINLLPPVIPGQAGANSNLLPASNYDMNTPSNQFLVPLHNANTFTYYRGATAWSAQPRGTAPNVVPNPMLTANTQSLFNMNSVAPIQQQQPLHQQNAPAVSNTKPRNRSLLKIQDPITLEEINLFEDSSKETTKPDKKTYSSDTKRVSESSSSASHSSTSSAPFSSKEQNQSVLNGSAPNVPNTQPASDWKGTSQSSATNNFTAEDTNSSAPSSMKPSASATLTSLSTQKTTIKEETPRGVAQPDDSKLRDKQNTPSWPETPTGVSTTIAASAQVSSQRAPVISSKKLSKETESPVSISSPNTSGPVLTSPTILTPTVSSSDGVNKTIVTRPTVALDDSEAGSKKTKQGIQSGMTGVPKDGIPSVKHPMGKPTVAPVVPSSSQSLPETTPTTASTGGPSTTAQSSLIKTDSKTQSSIPHQPAAQLQSCGATPITGVKPPVSAIPTSGPVSEKPIASSTVVPPSNEPTAKSTSGANAVQSNTEKTSLSSSSSQSSVKDEKTSPPTKSKNRGKDQSNDNSANEHSSSSAKNKTAQSVPKQQVVEHAKSNSTPPSNSTAVKQTNGEAVEQNVTSTGKTKKKKSSNKKELNIKGQEKEGSDMDIFKLEQQTTLPDKSVRAEKLSQQLNSQSLIANTNNRPKIISSQKSENVSSVVNSLDTKEKVINSQNIPNALPVPAQLTDTNKTENDDSVDDIKPGKKVYSVDFMLKMRALPQCKIMVNVNYLPVMSQGVSGPRGMSQNGFAGGGNFLPTFMNQPGGMSSSLAPRKSQQGSMRRDKPNQIHVSLSLREEVPLRRSKDAWKPTIFNNDEKNSNDDTKKSEALYKTARGILNKLTPEKYPVLVEKFKKLEIDSNERLAGVIDLIFEKAIDEPGFCKWYAEMCSAMQDVNVNEKESKSSFRALLLTKCQYQFESSKAEELDVDKKRAEINACSDPVKKKELQLVFEEKERKARRKSVGNCRFIGELFKLRMLTPKIMFNCIRTLLAQLEEESLECLCKLLTTIGKDLDEKLPKDLDLSFKRLQEIADPRKKEKISSRIRFMILDVIDLRRNKWVPRRETDNPKTIDQMNMEMEKKEQEQKIASMTMRKSYNDDYNNRNNRDSRKNRNDNQSNDNWTTVTNTKMSKFNYKYDAQKIANITAPLPDQESLSLGRPEGARSWRHGAGAPQKKSVTPAQTGVPAIFGTKTSGGKLTPSSSLERQKPNLPIRDDDTNKMTRSGSAQSVHPASRESSAQRSVSSRNTSQTAPTPTPSATPLSEDQIKKYSDTIFKEFISNQSVQDTTIDFTERFKADEDKQLAVRLLIEKVLDSPRDIAHFGKMVTVLLQAKVLSVEIVVQGASEVLQVADDLVVDYPKFWEYIANIFTGCPLLDDDCKLYNELKTVLQGLPNQEGCRAVLQEMEKVVRNDKDRIFEFLSRSIDTEDFDVVFKWIDEHVDSPFNNPKLVSALTEAVCKTALEKTSKSEDIKDKYGRYFKKYIDNSEVLELTCLRTIVDFSRRKEHPQGFLLSMFEGLYDSKALSSDSFMQLRKSQSEELGVVMMNVAGFYNYLNEQFRNAE